MNSIYNTFQISIPKIVEGIQVYEHMKYYLRKRDGKVCMFIDHGDGSGYLEPRVEVWSHVNTQRMMDQPEMRSIMGW